MALGNIKVLMKGAEVCAVTLLVFLSARALILLDDNITSKDSIRQNLGIGISKTFG